MIRSQSAASLRSKSVRGGRSASVVPQRTPQRQGKQQSVLNPCTACSRENISVEASHYCQECKENICQNCVNQHTKFASMRGHTIVSKLNTSNGDVILERSPFDCQVHPGKTADMFCPVHDVVRCGTCIAVNHRYFVSYLVINI